MPRLQVGIETTCTAPLWVERLGMRMAKLAGVDSLLLPDHYVGFVPRSHWKPQYTPAAKLVPSTDAFFDPFVMLGMMATRYPRVRIGTGVTEAFRRHPATLAQAFVTIDHMTRGRAITPGFSVTRRAWRSSSARRTGPAAFSEITATASGASRMAP